ncbi:hypothetical protein GCM10027451_19800 [Geodermatophilus aquaeductus]
MRLRRAPWLLRNGACVEGCRCGPSGTEPAGGRAVPGFCSAPALDRASAARGEAAESTIPVLAARGRIGAAAALDRLLRAAGVDVAVRPGHRIGE